MRRIPQLDGLRGIAIGLVLLHHYVYQLHAPVPQPFTAVLLFVAKLGWSGVDLFFILSGFLIGGILVDARDSANYYSTFYIRRAFRILPIYLLLVFIGFLLTQMGEHGAANRSGISLHAAPWLYYLTFTQNFFFASHAEVLWYLQITWSLAVEEQFYLTLPLLVRKISKEKLLAVAVGMVLFFSVLRSVLYAIHDITPMQSYVLPFCRFDSLFIGVACALLLRNTAWTSRFQKHPWLLLAGTIFFGGSFFLMNHNLWERNLLLHTAGFTLVGLFYASTMLLVLTRPRLLLSRALTYKPLMRLGTISYCVYLIHGPVLVIVDQIAQSRLGLSELEIGIAVLVGAAMTLLIAQASWTFFESRMVALGHKFTYAGANNPKISSEPGLSVTPPA